MTSYATFRDAVEDTEERRRDFFKLIFQNSEGWIGLSFKKHVEKKMEEEFFHYPTQLDQMLASIDRRAQSLTHVYFCPQLLEDPTYRREDGKGPRVKENVKTCTSLWADLDTCNPQYMQVPPSIVVQSSSGRWQAFWRLDREMDPTEAQLICQRIAYFHADQGADKGGWDLTQLLRVPYTPNYKYGDLITAPIVIVTSVSLSLYRASDFDVYPQYEALKKLTRPAPAIADLPQGDGVEILQRYRPTLNPHAFGLYSMDPDEEEEGEGWSGKLWKLEKICIEAGMTMEEVFIVANGASCNKYKRDGRPDGSLWQEISKAFIEHAEVRNLVPSPNATIPEFLTEEEIHQVQGRETFIERYIKQASLLTDASVAYHQAGAFIILSTILCNSVALPTSFGTVIPNLWFTMVGPTTLTRKTTAMNMVWDLIMDVDSDAIMATDGTPEGILSGLKDRTNRSSVYFRDEVTGLLEAMAHKDYMAGMAEVFSKLYDGKDVKRLLRKEEIHVHNPRFIIFAGGTREKTEMLLNEEHINSGFVPRFVFVIGEPDPSAMRPVGPPRGINIEAREMIKNELLDMHAHYNRERTVVLSDGKTSGLIKPNFDVELTDEAWKRYNDFEKLMLKTAMDSEQPHLIPVYDRLAKSTLKAAICIAASIQRRESITVTVEDLNHAIYYCQHWRMYANSIVGSVGKSSDERLIDSIMRVVSSSKENGIPRAELMKMFRMDAKKADLIFSTMTQRRLIMNVPFAGQARYYEV